MSYLKIWNEEIFDYEVFDIGRGRFHVNSKDWVITNRETEYEGGWNIVRFDDMNTGNFDPKKGGQDNASLIVDEIFLDYLKRKDLKNEDYSRVKVVNFGIDQHDGFDHSVAVPYGAAIFHVNENGKTIDRY